MQLAENNKAITKEKKPNLLMPILSLLLGFVALVAVLGVLVNLLFDYEQVTINGETRNMFHFKWIENNTFVIVPHVISIIIITVALLIMMFFINRKIKNADPLAKPKGLLLLVEYFVSSIDNFTVDMLGEKLKSFAPYIGYLAIYLFTANIFGLFGFTPPPTANLTVTLTFGLTTFILIRYYGIKYKGWGHVKSLFDPIPLSPINIIGELAVPFSLSLRLFGNILSGVIIMALVYGGIALGFGGLISNIFDLSRSEVSQYTEILAPFTFVIPLMHIYFDLFAGLIQTFVFILLTSVFISNASAED